MAGFTPPPYPYDRLVPFREIASAGANGALDLSIGTPCDPPPRFLAEAMTDPAAAQSYPASLGTPRYRESAAGWVARRFGVILAASSVAACVGTKEFVAGVPHWLRLRTPDRDTVLYPGVSYPSYAMGATLAGCRAVPVPVDERGHLQLDAVDDLDVARALCLWVNVPGNPTGGLDDLGAVAQWGRTHDVIVLSDECYAEFTWDGEARSVLQHGIDGVLAVHSLSKRSNFAGARIGFYAGDPDLVQYLSEVRKHGGLMASGPVQLAGALAWDDDDHVAVQRDRYRTRLDRLIDGFTSAGLAVSAPRGAFYLWLEAPGGDAWGLTERLATRVGMLVSPGEFYGPDGAGRVRVAAVQPLAAIEARMGQLAGL